MMASTKNDPHPHGPHVITHSATLDVPEATAVLLTDLLIAERRRRGTGIGARAASARDQAILVLRWFRQDADMPTLARDTGISVATGYRYLHEGIDVLADRAPDLHQVLEAGTTAGWSHVTLDGTLVRTDRCRVNNPDSGHDLWYSGKHRAHGGNVQVICDPAGFPVAVADVQPGSMHDLAAARGHRLPRCPACRGRPAGPTRPGRQGLPRRGHRHPHTGQGRQPGPQQRLPQPAADSAACRRRARYRPAQDPVESAATHPTVSSAHRGHRRRGPRSDHRRATNPLRTPQCLIRWLPT
ncbi:DDE superfamily endonuclease [Geodermatophilus pulveris]|uniref:DDE superfamily endonuclease n=1 Tax=Geodermatophilus pulveris TaxID=1564159 RepID=A0A239GKU3_9ACTN|nr:DDE superfamily endonuclease [Geodermatophilus pulveris]